MKVLGISGSPRAGKTTEGLVMAILDATGLETEFISLHGKKINGCIYAVLGCVGDNLCKVQDDYLLIMHKVMEADAIVIGAANYFGRLNALAHALLERFYCFRHDSNGHGGMKLSGKLGAIASVGGGGNWKMPGKDIKMSEVAGDDIKGFFAYNEIELVGAVEAQGLWHVLPVDTEKLCSVSGIKKFFSKDTKNHPGHYTVFGKAARSHTKGQDTWKGLERKIKK
ncbi:MAG: flavodoxin family protein [Planctomycetia bacterium]|nr:flavodoxin family protein [Planctomycetia bacterium]